LLHQQYTHLRHHIEHIVAKQHGGMDAVDNLALACHRCNLCKGPNLTGVDPHTRSVVTLFHPRHDRWHQHFVFRNARIEGLTPSGRATVELLKMNDARRIELRVSIALLSTE
jgi:HNH endonuclease